jgi:hypothetical protein
VVRALSLALPFRVKLNSIVTTTINEGFITVTLYDLRVRGFGVLGKYISEDYLENKNDDYNNLDDLEKEVVNEFKYIKDSTDNISNLLTK